MESMCNVCGLPKNICVCGQIAKESQKIIISLVKRRFNKYLTIVSGFDPTIVKDIAKTLKNKLACGGTINDDRIELQGNHRREIKEILVKEGFKENSIHD